MNDNNRFRLLLIFVFAAGIGLGAILGLNTQASAGGESTSHLYDQLDRSKARVICLEEKVKDLRAELRAERNRTGSGPVVALGGPMRCPR